VESGVVVWLCFGGREAVEGDTQRSASEAGTLLWGFVGFIWSWWIERLGQTLIEYNGHFAGIANRSARTAACDASALERIMSRQWGFLQQCTIAEQSPRLGGLPV
jgi:hypothetical protein